MSRTSRLLIIVVLAGIAVFAGFSIYADVDALRDRLAGFEWWAFGAALALALANYLIRFIRWALYLRQREIECSRSVSALTFLSGFALSITPGKVGELIKSYLLRASAGVPVSRSASIVVAERVTDLLALLVLGLLGSAIYGVATTMVAIGAAVMVLGLVVISWPPLAHRIIDLVSAPRFLARFRTRLYTFYDGLAELVRPAPLAWGTGLGIIAWMSECIGFALIVSAFPGADVSLGLATLIYATTTIAGALSFLPGGLLVTEAAMTAFLVSSSDIDEATAVAATILTRLATLWFAVLIGLVAMAVLRRIAPESAAALNADEKGAILPP